MKIKSDFITNSSSSSFIVVFSKRISKFEDVEHLISRAPKAKQVLKDALNQTPKKIKANDTKLIKKLANEMNHGYIDLISGSLTYSEYQRIFCEREGLNKDELYKNRSWMRSFYNEYEQMCLKACSKKSVEFLEENDGGYLYMFRYADEDGEFFSEMEHGGTFSKVPHITISKH